MTAALHEQFFFQVRYLVSRLLCDCSNISTVPKRASLIGLRTRTHCFWTGIFHVFSWEESQDQCCQLSQIIWKTPDFGPYFPVSRLRKYKISQIITEFCHFFSRLDFPTNKISKILLCLSYFNVNIERFLNSGMPLLYNNPCITGASWAKRGKCGILTKVRDEGRRKK